MVQLADVEIEVGSQEGDVACRVALVAVHSGDAVDAVDDPFERSSSGACRLAAYHARTA